MAVWSGTTSATASQIEANWVRMSTPCSTSSWRTLSLENWEHIHLSALVPGQCVQHRPVAVSHAGDPHQGLDDDAAAVDVGVRRRHADAGGQVVDVEQDL